MFGAGFCRNGATCGAVLVLLSFGFTGCTGEEPVPIDLSETVPTTSTADDAPADPNDPNAGERQRMNDLATQQCLDDATLSEGVVRLVDPETGETAGEVVIDCTTVR